MLCVREVEICGCRLCHPTGWGAIFGQSTTFLQIDCLPIRLTNTDCIQSHSLLMHFWHELRVTWEKNKFEFRRMGRKTVGKSRVRRKKNFWPHHPILRGIPSWVWGVNFLRGFQNGEWNFLINAYSSQMRRAWWSRCSTDQIFTRYPSWWRGLLELSGQGCSWKGKSHIFHGQFKFCANLILCKRKQMPH